MPPTDTLREVQHQPAVEPQVAARRSAGARAPSRGPAAGRATPAVRPIVVPIAAPVTPSSGNGPSPKIRQGSSTTFTSVGEPQRAHRDRRVARAAEDGVDQEQQQDRRVAAQHPGGVAPADLDHGGGRAHQPQQRPRPEGRERERHRRREAEHRSPAPPCARPPPAASRRCAAPRARSTDIDSPIATANDTVRSDSVSPTAATASGPQPPDEVHVEHAEDRLHHHLEDHRHGQQEHGPAQAALGVVLLRALDGLLQERPGGPQAASSGRLPELPAAAAASVSPLRCSCVVRHRLHRSTHEPELRRSDQTKRPSGVSHPGRPLKRQ